MTDTASNPPPPSAGSSLYYSLLYLPPEARQRTVQALHMTRSLSSTLHDVSEPQVAQQKVRWWHEEIDRLIQGIPRHPGMAAVADQLAGCTEARGPCIDLIACAAENRLEPLSTDAERRERLQRDGRARIRLLQYAATGDTTWLSAPLPDSSELAYAHAAMDQLLQLPALLHRGYPVFSSETYQHFDLTPTKLASGVAVALPVVPMADPETGLDLHGESTEPLKPDGEPEHRITAEAAPDTAANAALFEATTRDTLNAFERGRADWAHPAHDHPAGSLPLLTLAALREQQCRLWLKRRPDLLRERHSLMPLHKLFIAWRCRRQGL